MKRAIPFIIAFAFLFCGCTAADENAGVSDFSKDATVLFHDFTYECVISYNGSSVTVSAQSTSAAGLVISYDGKYVGISYDDISLTQINSNFEPANPAVALYEVFEFVNGVESADFSTTKSGFIVQGETTLGSFTLETDSDYSPVNISFAGAELEFQFS